MDRLLNISDMTNIALHVLALTAQAGTPVTAASAASRLGVSPSYLAKVLQPVAAAGILASKRGAAGGFVMARDPATVTALDVLELLDGKLPARDCLFAKSVCPLGTCSLKELSDSVTETTRRVLRKTTIAALAESFAPWTAHAGVAPRKTASRRRIRKA
jgi:Rrf2 family protein